MKLLCAKFTLVALSLLAQAACPPCSAADQPLGKIKVKSITLTFSDDDFAVLRLSGTAADLGNCVCDGEIVFVPSAEEGTLDGMGVVAFRAANGDLLVGVIAAKVDTVDRTFDAEIRWRDAVTFSDGTTVESTGRFVGHLPTGKVAMADFH